MTKDLHHRKAGVRDDAWVRRGMWGPWHLHLDDYTLYVEPDEDGQQYEIDLESCTTSAQLCDWIFQVYGNTWADERTVAGLVCALDDILRPQENLCAWGQSLRLSKRGIRALVDDYSASHEPGQEAPR